MRGFEHQIFGGASRNCQDFEARINPAEFSDNLQTFPTRHVKIGNQQVAVLSHFRAEGFSRHSRRDVTYLPEHLLQGLPHLDCIIENQNPHTGLFGWMPLILQSSADPLLSAVAGDVRRIARFAIAFGIILSIKPDSDGGAVDRILSPVVDWVMGAIVVAIPAFFILMRAKAKLFAQRNAHFQAQYLPGLRQSWSNARRL